MSKISIKPLADRVLVEPSEAETKTSSGIIIPDSAKEKPQRGKIVAVGPGTKENPVTLKAGDIVLYGKYAGTELNHNGVDYLIIKENGLVKTPIISIGRIIILMTFGTLGVQNICFQ